jgi:hypothetical protein
MNNQDELNKGERRMSELTEKEKDELLLGLRCHSAHESESTFIIMAQQIKTLERQLAEARKNELKLLQEVEPVFSNFDSSPWRLEDDEPEIAQIWYNVLDRLKQLKEKGDGFNKTTKN